MLVGWMRLWGRLRGWCKFISLRIIKNGK